MDSSSKSASHSTATSSPRHSASATVGATVGATVDLPATAGRHRRRRHRHRRQGRGGPIEMPQPPIQTDRTEERRPAEEGKARATATATATTQMEDDLLPLPSPAEAGPQRAQPSSDTTRPAAVASPQQSDPQQQHHTVGPSRHSAKFRLEAPTGRSATAPLPRGGAGAGPPTPTAAEPPPLQPSGVADRRAGTSMAHVVAALNYPMGYHSHFHVVGPHPPPLPFTPGVPRNPPTESLRDQRRKVVTPYHAPARQDQVCWDFVQGTCVRGDRCPLRHLQIMPPPLSPPPPPPPRGQPPAPPQ